MVSQAGALLLTQVLQVTGLRRRLSEGLGRWRAARATHDPGKIIADLAVALALGGDCLADVAGLREQPAAFGPVASRPGVSPLVRPPAPGAPRARTLIRAARGAPRGTARGPAGQAAPGADGGLITIDLDATIVIAHSPALATRSSPGIWPSAEASGDLGCVADVKVWRLLVRWHLVS